MQMLPNGNSPLTMHVDLNSCFATIKQQSSPHLRGKPLVIAAYDSPAGCIVAPSIEAKKFGIKTGMSVREARLLCRDVIVRTPDPAMVRDVHYKFSKIARDYSPLVTPKSIDEVVIDFAPMQHLKMNLLEIGHEIKSRLRCEIGEWISCNIGIGTNRFLAKLAAGLHKPDGLDLINAHNLKDTYSKLKLTDFNGISSKFEARLNACGIYSPLEFLDATIPRLQNEVFKSRIGYYWYLRLRGYEIDDFISTRKSFGQEYSLGQKSSDPKILHPILMKLAEKTGRRLRHANMNSRGVQIGILYSDGTFWHKSKTFSQSIYTTNDIYLKLIYLSNLAPKNVVAKYSVACFDLASSDSSQETLFDGFVSGTRDKILADTLDAINSKWGEFTIVPTLMMGLEDQVIDRISFGGVGEIESMYE